MEKENIEHGKRAVLFVYRKWEKKIYKMEKERFYLTIENGKRKYRKWKKSGFI